MNSIFKSVLVGREKRMMEYLDARDWAIYSKGIDEGVEIAAVNAALEAANDPSFVSDRMMTVAEFGNRYKIAKSTIIAACRDKRGTLAPRIFCEKRGNAWYLCLKATKEVILTGRSIIR